MTTPTHNLRTRRYKTRDLAPYFRNPRRGNIAAIKASLLRLGQFRPVVVNAGSLTGRPLEVLAGNHTLAAFLELEGETRAAKWKSILGVEVDVDEDEAARIVAADNRTSDLGEYDDRELLELLSSLPDFEGVSYSDEDLALLRRVVDAGDAFTVDQSGAIDELLGITGLDGEPIAMAYFDAIGIYFRDEAARDLFFDTIGGEWQPGMKRLRYPLEWHKGELEEFDD